MHGSCGRLIILGDAHFKTLFVESKTDRASLRHAPRFHPHRPMVLDARRFAGKLRRGFALGTQVGGHRYQKQRSCLLGWSRTGATCPQALSDHEAEIRAIENTEFGTGQRISGR